jgi:hypothetical protein
VADVLSLGGITFDNFSPPSRMPWGGRQAMAVHKLLGGSRVVDTLGPDDRDISWHGFIYQNDALSMAQSLDALRIAGTALPLSWGAEAAVVVISEFNAEMVRWPSYIEYSITCTVAFSGAQGFIGAAIAGVDALVGADLTAAAGLLA